MSETKTEWSEIKAAYVTSADSLPQLAQRFGVSIAAIKKQSAKGKWSSERRKRREKKAQQVADKIQEAEVRQTVRDIERCCRAAGRLIEKINKAIGQLDKTVYVSQDDQVLECTTVKPEDGEQMSTEIVTTKKKRHMKTRRMDALIDTKRISDLAKSLVNIKQVLTGEDGTADENDSGMIMMVPMTELDLEEGHENGVETPAEAGADDEPRGG